MPPVVGSSLILGLLHQSWQQRDLLSLVQATKTKRKYEVIIWNCLKEVCRYRLIESDSPLFCRLISVAGKKIYVTFIFSLISFHARMLPQWLAGSSWKGLSRHRKPLHYLALLSCIFLSFPVMSCPLACPALSVLSWPWKRWYVSQDKHLPSIQPTRRKANRMVFVQRCQPIPRRMQTPSTICLHHWTFSVGRVWGFFAQIHPQRTSVCLKRDGKVVYQTLPC